VALLLGDAADVPQLGALGEVTTAASAHLEPGIDRRVSCS
jgi:hypothetical protein